MTTYDYDGIFLPEDERPFFCHVMARDEDGTCVDFYVNKHLEGMFVKDGNDYHQVKGTMQFSLANKSKRSIQRILKKLLDEARDE